MLIGYALKFTFIASLCWTTLVAGTLVLTPADENLQNFAHTSEDCRLPCWMGIRPGVTPVNEALQILNQYPGVSHLEYEQGYGFVRWQWTGQQPHIFDESAGASMFIHDGMADAIFLQMTVRLADIEAVMGEPEGLLMFLSGANARPYAARPSLIYDGVEFRPTGLEVCPHHGSLHWDSPALVILHGNGLYDYTSPENRDLLLDRAWIWRDWCKAPVFLGDGVPRDYNQ